MSKQRIDNLYKEAGELHQRAKGILNEYDGKDMPQEKSTEVDTLFDQVEARVAEAKRLERAEQQEKTLGEPANPLGPSGAQGKGSDQPQNDQEALKTKAFNRYLRNGEKGVTPTEMRALSADDDQAGGFVTAPTQFASGLLKFVDDQVNIRGLATVDQILTGESLGIVSLDTDFGDADWTTELQTGNEETAKPFGGRELRPHPMARRIKISNTLIRRANKPIEQIVQQRLSYRVAVTQEKAYMTGDGAQKPLGMFIASNQGIPTSRDVTCASSTAFTADELIDLKFFLKSQYQMSKTTRWLTSREFVKRTRKLKDGDGNYMWAPGLGGQPATILDVPFVMSEFAPNTFTTGQYIALLGDLQFYNILDSLNLQIQVLLELYAETNQRGYIVRYEGDGMPVLAEAFARLKLA
jgi:HK97 family phage major capsid protein